MVPKPCRAYERITKAICDKLEQGVVPWSKPWHTGHNAPLSVATGKHYRGINALVLACQDYTDPRWITFKNAKQLGGHVRKGERGTPIVLWKFWERENDETGETEHGCFVRGYTVFNVAQCDDLDESRFPALEEEPEALDFNPIEVCENVISEWHTCPRIRHRGSQAFYRPTDDTITMPETETFRSTEEYYSTLFHEATHATGHASRLNRKGVTGTIRFGSKEYSREELVAELGAAFLCGHAGIENVTLDNSASYCQGWLLRLKADASLIPIAAQQAQRAADHILNLGEAS